MGLIALQGTETRLQLDYVKTEFERMQDDVCNELEKYFSEKGRALGCPDIWCYMVLNTVIIIKA